MQIQRVAGLVRVPGTSGLAVSIEHADRRRHFRGAHSALAARVGSYASLAFLACSLEIGAVDSPSPSLPSWSPI